MAGGRELPVSAADNGFSFSFSFATNLRTSVAYTEHVAQFRRNGRGQRRSEKMKEKKGKRQRRSRGEKQTSYAYLIEVAATQGSRPQKKKPKITQTKSV